MALPSQAHIDVGPFDSNSFQSEQDKKKPFLCWKRILATTLLSLAVVLCALVYFDVGGVQVKEHGAATPRQDGELMPMPYPQFDLSEATIPESEIRRGGPPKDGIPALSNPNWISAKVASYLQSTDRVIGFVQGEVARAYPLKILNHHEIVNDRVGDLPIAVTYCPLCDSAAVFDRRTELGLREFGVSGLLFNSNVLMYDRTDQTESLWSQARAGGVSGPGADKNLVALPMELTTWEQWRQRYPESFVLSTDTGHNRDYQRNPYANYFREERLMFPAEPMSDRLPAKERVLGVWVGTTTRAYPESAFTAEKPAIEDTINGKRIVIQYSPNARSLRVVDVDADVQWMYSFWFAWHAMHPETTVYE